MEHTKEPWKTVFRGDDECFDIDAKGPDGWRGDVTIALNIGKGNARRIVACVNACAGISTENLEDNLPVKELVQRYNEAIKQRDELLAVLEKAETVIRELESVSAGEHELADELASTIERVKGGAQ